jgi:glucose uptake protein GlcU
VIGRLSWGKVHGTGAVSGAWFGLFVGLLLSFFSAGVNIYQPILVGLLSGMLFGLVFAAISYASTRGRRDFSSASQLVAGRYDVLCQPRTAEQGRELLAKLAMRPST